MGYSPKEKTLTGEGEVLGVPGWNGRGIWGGDDQDTRHTCTELSKRQSIKTTAAADTRVTSQEAKAVLHIHCRRLEPHRGKVLSVTAFRRKDGSRLFASHELQLELLPGPGPLYMLWDG